MIRLNNFFNRVFIALFFVLSTVSVFGQAEAPEGNIISPFDSLSVSNLTATGNLQTGAVQVKMRVQNDYHKMAQIDFGGGTFDDFGVIDDKGARYKYSSNDDPHGLNSGINKGYSRISDLKLGKNKVTMLISVQDTLHNGQSRILSFTLPKADKSVKGLTEIHIMTTLTLNYMFTGQKQTVVKNIPITWAEPKQQPVNQKQD
jgi:hypothetical protein